MFQLYARTEGKILWDLNLDIRYSICAILRTYRYIYCINIHILHTGSPGGRQRNPGGTANLPVYISLAVIGVILVVILILVVIQALRNKPGHRGDPEKLKDPDEMQSKGKHGDEKGANKAKGTDKEEKAEEISKKKDDPENPGSKDKAEKLNPSEANRDVSSIASPGDQHVAMTTPNDQNDVAKDTETERDPVTPVSQPQIIQSAPPAATSLSEFPNSSRPPSSRKVHQGGAGGDSDLPPPEYVTAQRFLHFWLRTKIQRLVLWSKPDDQYADR